MTELTANVRRTFATRRPAELPLYAACAGVALCTFLPWLHVSYGSLFGDPSFTGADAHEAAAFNSMMRGMNVASIGGLRLAEGIVALLAALVAMGLTWGEASGTLRQAPRVLRLCTLVAVAVGALSVLFAFTRAGGPLGLSFGFFLAALAAGAAVVVAVRRLQALPAVSPGTAFTVRAARE